MSERATTVEEVRDLLAAVVDPEIPVLTIEDLGILREVRIDESQIVVTITPTYSGCPAMDQIKDDIRTRLAGAGLGDIEVETVYAPAWTTDWISEAGKRKLADYGIAPPQLTHEARAVLCPRCDSAAVRTVSEFGSTACKALMVCSQCGEPFDHFKAI